MTNARIQLTRRGLLAGLGALALPGFAAPFSADGPALQRPLAKQAQMLDLALAGSRLVAAGERGIVLLSDDQGANWRQARSVPTRTTLTALQAVDAKTLFAVGHGGLVLTSADAGESWQRVHGEAGGKEVLLSVRVQADGTGLAVGGFGHALRTRDGGRSWQAAAPLLDGEDGERHLNRLFVSPQGSWLIAAEGGLLLRSEDAGQHWQAQRSGYEGSWWSGAAVGDGALVVCGMRGHWAISRDDGRSWAAHAIEGAGSLTAVVPLPGAPQRCVLAGVDGTLATGALDSGQFRLLPPQDRSTLTALLPLSATRVAAASSEGMKRLELPA